ncbi:MAG: adenylosuccinate synthase [Candidatus Aminicenantes bacterium]|nr:adenylosuccinate synthase [Candidatus Aminicenantes bacterium]RLE05355.1 MAG: adenylosuccinate synthase [Candidatus Aminicenantes bacterium]
MKNLAVIGVQWGDEGKGKIIDLLTPSFDIIARYQGGHNAGHTVCIGKKRFVLHLIPSGILHREKLCVIGNGVVIDPQAFFKELETLKQLVDLDEKQIVLSARAHIIFPYHFQLEKLQEEMRGDKKIGTTFRGIGPAYVDKYARMGIRAGDLLNEAYLREKISLNLAEKNIILQHFNLPLLNEKQIYEAYLDYAQKLRPFIKEISSLLHQEIERGKKILFEGAQGTLLDIDYGTYPYVTSSNATAGGICTGLGLPPEQVHEVLGVVKAYTTRVGGGPFPSEAEPQIAEWLQEKGHEFGATTGRPRRCGWFDLVAVGYACRINGIKKLALMKADVLDELEEIPVCLGYQYKGTLLKEFPPESWVLEKVKPVYKIFKGWQRPLKDVSSWEELPSQLLDYIHFIEDNLGVEVVILSTGQGRRETLIKEKELATLML